LLRTSSRTLRIYRSGVGGSVQFPIWEAVQ
jgi:hypothetical protein